MATRPGGADLSRTKSYQYPAEHVGHLGSGHAGALEKFKQLCQAKGYYIPAEPTTNRSEPSHDDETLLRYLRARKWIPEEAFQQFAETEDWRKENKLDQLYETIDVEDYEVSRRLYPQWTGRRDNRGIPIYVYEVANLNAKAVAGHEASTKKPVAGKVPARLMRLFALYENLVYFVFPLCSQIPDRPFPETPISQSTNIVDISNVGLKQFWNLKRHMEDASQLATAHYPETLASIYVIGAPSFFPTVWGWIKRWFDPITVSKIYILNERTMKSTFAEAIDPANLPKKYGGTLDWKFGDLPNVDPAIQEAITWKTASKSIPTGPIRWRTVGTEQVAYAVGTENGKPRQQEIMSTSSRPSKTQASLGVGEENLEIYRTTSGMHTHPPSPPAGATEEVEPSTPPSDLDSNYPNSAEPSRESTWISHQGYAGSNAPNTRSAISSANTPTEAGSTSAIAATSSADAAPTNTTDRQGTTSTRYMQQDYTHGAGQQAADTPNNRLTADGDRVGVMDPHTVSQAPKEHPMPIASDADPDASQASYVDTAKDLAGAAYGQAAGVATAALGALGLGGKDVEADKVDDQPETKAPDDPRVDAVPTQNVEDFLRSRVTTSTTGKK